MKNSSNEIISTSENIKNAIKEINNLMNNSSHDLNNQAKITLKVVSEIKSNLKEEINELNEIANAIKTHSRLGEASIKRKGSELSKISEDVIIKIGSINGKISSTINNILNLSGQLDNKFNTINDNILQKTNQAAKIIQDSVDRSISNTNHFRDMSSTFMENTTKTNMEINRLIANLQQETVALDGVNKSTAQLIGNISLELIKASKSIPELNNNITNVNNQLNSTNDTIEKSITSTNIKTKELIENLDKIEEQFTKFTSEKASEMDYLSKASTQAITKVAGYANKLSQETKQNLEDLKKYYSDLGKIETTNAIQSTKKSTDKFLNETGFIIEKLNSIAIDITQILIPDSNQNLWDKYNSGHKGIFSKYLSRTLNRNQLSNLEHMMQSNKTFASYVKSFVSEFESVILKASTTDKSDVLIATLTSTDIGKVYMLLREIV